MQSALIRSLRRFQVGERDGSRIYGQVTRSTDSFLTTDLRTAILRCVDEERRHGDVLAALLRRLGSEPARRDASAIAFKIVRRILGLRAKLVVLVAAEIVGAAFYDAVASNAGDATVAEVMSSIRDDERAHLAFVITLSRAMVACGETMATRLAWRLAVSIWLWVVTLGALAVVSLDHAPFLRRAGWYSVVRPAVADLRWFTRELWSGSARDVSGPMPAEPCVKDWRA